MVAATTLFVHWQMFPSKIVRNSMPKSGDLLPHVSMAWYAGHRLFPSGRISGWSMGWFTGFPVQAFYFPLASAFVALLDSVLPLAVAIKVVATLGPLTLPPAAYAFGRLNGRDRAASACLAVGVLPLLLEPLLHVSGGTIVSAAASGEYAYSLSMSAGLLALGVVGAGLRTGRYRALAAALLAATVLFHILPALVTFVGVALMTVLPPARARLRWAVPVVLTSVAVTAAWLVPFVAQGQFTGGRDCPKQGPLLPWLLPIGILPVAVVALCGLAVATLVLMAEGGQGDRLRLFMGLMALVGAFGFAVTPTGQVCNVRFLPLWYLWACLLAGDTLGRFARFLDRRRKAAARGRPLASPTRAAMALPVLLLAVVPLVWATRLGPGIVQPVYDFVTTYPNYVLSGYEGDPEERVRGFGAMLRDVGREHGCGRAYWEWTSGIPGINDASLMIHIPYLTNWCISVVRGLYMEASATSRFLEATGTLLSPTKEAEPPPPQLSRGLADLRLLGTRYLIAGSREVQEPADRSPELRLLAQADRGEGQHWKVYEIVPRVEMVEPLAYEPVVVPGSGASRVSWQEVTGPWYAGKQRDVVLAADGPSHWPRSSRPATDLPRRSVAATTTVSGVRMEDERISFDVSQVGTPMLVKVSYFPNWRADGARGPWRVSPNQMVVVPTASTVTLRYGRSLWDGVGLVVSLAGLVAVVVLARRPPLAMIDVDEEADAAPEKPKRKPGKKPSGKASRGRSKRRR